MFGDVCGFKFTLKLIWILVLIDGYVDLNGFGYLQLINKLTWKNTMKVHENVPKRETNMDFHVVL